jgi:hypothetical protein
MNCNAPHYIGSLRQPQAAFRLDADAAAELC